MGKVKNSGSFGYTPGITVLHAIALAGGFDNTPMEPWQVAELSRQAEQVQQALDHAVRMIARTVAIEASRSAQSVTIRAQKLRRILPARKPQLCVFRKN